MALIVETGANVPNANSFVTRAELIAFASARGVVIADVDASDVYAIKATDALMQQEPRLQGVRTYSTQALPFPRDGIVINCAVVAPDAIPDAVKAAQLFLALASAQGVELVPARAANEKFLVRQELGPIKREFSEAAYLASGDLPTIPQVTALLLPYMKSGGASRSYRV